MSNLLVKANDELLAFVDKHSEPPPSLSDRIHYGDEFEEFLRLDSQVYIASRRANLLDALPDKEGRTLGKTGLPVMSMVDGEVPRTFSWKVEMLTLRELAEDKSDEPAATRTEDTGKVNLYAKKKINARMLEKISKDNDTALSENLTILRGQGY